MNEVDYKILNVLSENSRLSLRQIAKRVSKSTATVMKHISNLEKSGVIKKYSVSVNYDALGFELQAIIKIFVGKGKLLEVEKKIASQPNVCAVYDVTGQADIIAVVRFKTKNTLDKFLKKIQGFDFVKKTETIIILNTMKDDNVNF